MLANSGRDPQRGRRLEGALAHLPTGAYVQIDGANARYLDQAAVAAAISEGRIPVTYSGIRHLEPGLAREPSQSVTNLRAIEEALTAFTEIDLRALIIASNEVPRIAPGLLAWIEGACVGELNRRRGFDVKLQPLAAVIDQSQEVVCIKATFALQASFFHGEMAPTALQFLCAVMDLLTGVEPTQEIGRAGAH